MRQIGYRKLDVWHKGIEIVEATYAWTEKFPSNERFGLIQQMQRSAVSIPSNIAEGYTRGQIKDYVRFLRIALGSCAELETQGYIAAKRAYIEEKASACFLEKINHEMRMLLKMVHSLRQKSI